VARLLGARMTDFVESFATQHLLPPYHSAGATVNAFVFKLAPHVIQSYCDRFFNLGATSQRPFHYEALPWARIGILIVTQYPNISSLNEENPEHSSLHARQWDDLQQTELYATIPVARYRVASHNILVDRTIEWVQPFLILDNSTSAFSGREILGLESLYGEIKCAPATDASGFSAKTTLLSWKVFSPTSLQQMLPFVEIQTEPPLAPDAGSAAPVADDESAVWIEELRALIPNLDGLVGGMFPAAMPLAILKQFRDAADPAKAIYQALVTARSRYSSLRNLQFYDPDKCLIQFTEGAMVDEIISTFLDLRTWAPPLVQAVPETPQPKVLPVKMAFSFTADIDLDEIRTLHTFST
jgi:hypothetical protein